MKTAPRRARWHILTALFVTAGCAGGTLPPEVTPVKEKYSRYTLAQAEREGFKRDPFCLDATAFGQPASHGAMGFHATDETRLRGPIEVDRPQAIMFGSDGRVLGVEYEVMTDAVPQPPQLFGRTFAKLPPHPGVDHEHYALHVWFGDNPSGVFSDFNPKVSCPAGSTPAGGAGPAHGGGH